MIHTLSNMMELNSDGSGPYGYCKSNLTDPDTLACFPEGFNRRRAWLKEAKPEISKLSFDHHVAIYQGELAKEKSA